MAQVRLADAVVLSLSMIDSLGTLVNNSIVVTVRARGGLLRVEQITQNLAKPDEFFDQPDHGVRLRLARRGRDLALQTTVRADVPEFTKLG